MEKEWKGGAPARVRYSRKKRAEEFSQRAKLLRSYGIMYTSGERPPVNQPTGNRGVVIGDQAEPLNPAMNARSDDISVIGINVGSPNAPSCCYLFTAERIDASIKLAVVDDKLFSTLIEDLRSFNDSLTCILPDIDNLVRQQIADEISDGVDADEPLLTGQATLLAFDKDFAKTVTRG
ncbi:hypothetical protein V492_05357 [Pseudogymnoascus sp. VKM F-4246]|nr:hypothetical protein V492_05357 [Pseudogymnoascus sp. VKM F-4246]